MAIVAARNTIFVRHLSPQVSESVLRQTFGQCDHIEQVLFRAFPGRVTEYYAQIDFRSSKGVVEGHKLSGTPILGVTCQVSIMDPGSKDLMRKVWESRQTGELPEELQAPSMAEPQGVQAEYIRRYREQAEAKRLKTVHVAGLDETHTEENLRVLCTKFGEIQDMRLDKDEQGTPFALVEFKEAGPAAVAKSRQGFVVDGKIIVFTEAKTMVNTMGYAEQSVHFQSPVLDQATMKAVLNFQSHLNPKLAKARIAAAEILNEPIPEELKKQEEEEPPEPEQDQPVEWAGRSEKDLLRELALASKRPPSRERRRRPGSSRSRDRSRRRRRSGGRRERGRRRAGDGRKSRHRSRKRHKEAKEHGQEAVQDSVDVDDLDLAVVPNTELLVLGESSSYSSDLSPSPQRDGQDADATSKATSQVNSHNTDEIPEKSSSAPNSSAWNTTDAAADALERAEPSILLEVAEPEATGPAGAGVLDVDEKEQWLPAVDVDEEGSCDEIVVAKDDPSSPCSVIGSPVHGLSENCLDGTTSVSQGGSASASQTQAGKADGDVAAQGGNGLVVAAASGPVTEARLAEGLACQSPSKNLGARLIADFGQRADCAPESSPCASPSATPSQWECATCGEVNKNSRDRCNNCGGDAPWITVKSPDGDDVDELSSASSPGTPSSAKSVAESAPRSIADVAESPARSVAESPARSIAASGSARSVADIDDSDGDHSMDSMIDLAELEKQEEDECRLEAERVRGEVADARARIFHGAP